MKRLLALLLVLTVLAGCTVHHPTEPGRETEPPTTAPTAPPAPSLYEPGSQVENQTNGAVRAYPLGGHCDGMLLLQDRVVLYYLDEQMQLKAYSGQELRLEDTATHHIPFPANGTGIQVMEQGIFYYNAGSGSVVVLDGQLRQKQLVELPDEIRGIPVINGDMNTVYYCTAEGIRAMNLSTGIAHMLRQQADYSGSAWGQCFDGSLMVCTVTGSDGNIVTEFVSTETGLQAGKDGDIRLVESCGDRFFLRRGSDHGTWLFGTRNGDVFEFLMPEERDVLPVLELGGVLTVSRQAEGYVLDYIDLDSGLRTASVTLPGLEQLRNVVADPGGYIWFMDEDTLYRWEISKSAVSDETVYTSPWYTGSDPNEAGLAQCQADAAALGQKYGLEILLWKDAVEGPWEKMTPEFRVSVYEEALPVLEEIFARFPEGMLKKIGSIYDSKTISVSLVADSGADQGQVAWEDGNVYIAVEADQNLRTELLRTLYRVMDTYVLSETSMLDEWNADKPAEDRARFFVEAMTEDNAEFFKKSSAQSKLRTLCRGIRDAFGMKKYAGELPWEQYLNKPLYK